MSVIELCFDQRHCCSYFSHCPKGPKAVAVSAQLEFTNRYSGLLKTVNESAVKHCSEIQSLSQKQWLEHKAVLDSESGLWQGHHCGHWQRWQQRLSPRTDAVLKMLVTAQLPSHGWSISGVLCCHRNFVYLCGRIYISNLIPISNAQIWFHSLNCNITKKSLFSHSS